MFLENVTVELEASFPTINIDEEVYFNFSITKINYQTGKSIYYLDDLYNGDDYLGLFNYNYKRFFESNINSNLQEIISMVTLIRTGEPYKKWFNLQLLKCLKMLLPLPVVPLRKTYPLMKFFYRNVIWTFYLYSLFLNNKLSKIEFKVENI